MKRMARCNHLLALPIFPATAALLANAASISAWSVSSSSNACFSHLHHSPCSLQNNHQLRSASSSSSTSSTLHRLRLKPNYRFPANNGLTAWCDTRCGLCSVADNELSDWSDDGIDIASSVGDSLRCDLVQPHLDKLNDASINEDAATNNGNHCNSKSAPNTLVLVLAVSGGCDSIALFHAILALTKPHTTTTTLDDEKGYQNNDPPFWLHLGIDDSRKNLKASDFKVPCELHVAHFNHEQRDENSDGDETFVRNLCMENDIPLHSYSWSDSNSAISSAEREDGNNASDGLNGVTNELASSTKSFTQDIARKWRRLELKELLANRVLSPDATTDSAGKSKWGAILTAHHRDDADETILLKLLRGSHLTNLRGMDARSDGFDLQLMCDTGTEPCVDLHSSSQLSGIGYFAKPMLNVRKRHVREYLTSKSLQWREDESNSSTKYKRNKVRNELMPLLGEIAGGERALQKRFSNLEQQSRDISRDISKRSKDYIESMPSNSAFILQTNSGTHVDIVQEEALFSWIMKVTNRKLQVSYDQMLRIRDQIHNYPDRLQWTLDVGNLWKLRRNGDTLVVFKEEGDSQPPYDGIDSSTTIPWKIISTYGLDAINSISTSLDPDSNYVVHELQLGIFPTISEFANMKISRVKDCGNIKFSPLWRKGRSAIKIKEFLRGQKVPLHRREEATVLCFSDDSTTHALAVYLEGTVGGAAGKWIVNANFCPRDSLPVTKVVLGKTSLL